MPQTTAGLVSSMKSNASAGAAGANSYEIQSSLLLTEKATDIVYRNAAQVLPLAIAYRTPVYRSTPAQTPTAASNAVQPRLFPTLSSVLKRYTHLRV
jgi:hypothetical protein